MFNYRFREDDIERVIRERKPILFEIYDPQVEIWEQLLCNIGDVSSSYLESRCLESCKQFATTATHIQQVFV